MCDEFTHDDVFITVKLFHSIHTQWQGIMLTDIILLWEELATGQRFLTTVMQLIRRRPFFHVLLGVFSRSLVNRL